MSAKKFLIIQTAFIGDAILATALLEELHEDYPNASIDYLIRKGNESLFKNHPFIDHLYVWDKKEEKYRNLYRLLKTIRKEKYDYLINLQRFAATGLFAVLSGARQKIGFRKNPFSFFFDIRAKHDLNNGMHETERNRLLISHLCKERAARPRLYPSENEFKKVTEFKSGKYICISPASVWFTKQFPVEKWIEFADQIERHLKVYLLGAPNDNNICEEIKHKSSNQNIENLAGSLNLLESAALMKDAAMNYTNDSAPMHLASAMNAPTVAIFCSTVPEFGFGPLASKSVIVQAKEKLGCRPCGLHGKKSCPEVHFRCAYTIDIQDLLLPLKD
jgi:heptosyltransferase-2